MLRLAAATVNTIFVADRGGLPMRVQLVYVPGGPECGAGLVCQGGRCTALAQQ